MTWPSAALGDVCTITMGQAPSGSSYNDVGNGTPLIAGAGDFLAGMPRPKKHTTEPGKLAQAGDIVLGIRATIGVKVLADSEYCLGRGVAGLRAGRHVDTRYLWQWLGYAEKALDAKGRGATFRQVNRNDLATMEIPLPPLPEQRRIAAILDHADTLCTKRKQVVERIDELLLSEFISRFGAPVTNPSQLPTARIGQLGGVVTGNTPPRAQAELYGDDIEWIKSDNIDPRTPLLRRATEGLSAAGMARSRIATSGSLLVTCIAGSPNSIGNVAIADRDVSFNQQINAFTPFERPTEFWYYQLRLAKPLVQAASTGGMKGLVSKSAFSEIVLLAPSVDMCEEYARIVRKVWEHRSRIVSALDASKRLSSSLQYASFRGEL